MRRMIHLVLLLMMLGGAAFLWMRIFPSPERQIRNRMTQLQELISFDSSDGNFAALAALQQLGSMFTRDASVRVDVQGGPKVSLAGRDSIVQAAGGARRTVEDLHVKFVDVVVTLSEDKRSAVVEATGMARQKDGDELWVEDLRFHFIRTDEGWMISSVETVETLTRRNPGGPLVVRVRRSA